MLRLEHEKENDEPDKAVRIQLRKVSEAVTRRREMDRALSILVDEYDDAFRKSLKVDFMFFRQSTSKRARLESELEICCRYQPGHFVEDSLAFWIKISKYLHCQFPSVAKLALNIVLIPAMSAV